MGLSGEWAMHCDTYIEVLKEVEMRLKVEDDKLFWSKNKKNGTIIAKLAYEYIANNWNKVDNTWWYKNLWEWNVPQKMKCFWWLTLKDNLLT